ncbi:MAG: TROVE domain-containing protein [Limisphaerales bacterium]
MIDEGRNSAGRGVPSAEDSEVRGCREADADWVRLDRFLTLGAESGPFVAGGGGSAGDDDAERGDTDNAGTTEPPAVVRCIRSDAQRVVARVLETFEAGRAAPNGAGIRVLALVTALGDDAGRSAACAGVPKVCGTAGELFLFARWVTGLRGWGRGLRRAVGNWYRGRFADDLAYQVVKCPRRAGWSHRDLLRLSHPTPATREQAAVFRWILGGAGSLGRRTVLRRVPPSECGEESAGGGEDPGVAPRNVRAVTYPGVGELPRLLRGLEEAKRASTVGEVVRLIAERDLPREAVPAAWLGEVSVWDALLHRMPLASLLGDLGRFAAVGLLAAGSEAAWWIETRLRNPEVLRASRLHPMAFFLARRAYEEGSAPGEAASWNPVPSVVRALEDAFYAAFANVRPVRRSLWVTLDLSASTRRACLPGTRVPVLDAAAAMALVAVSTEPSCVVAGFSSGVACRIAGSPPVLPGLTLLELLPGMRLEEVMDQLATVVPGPPEPALPMEWALRHRIPVEGFITYTDGEMWMGEVVPSAALDRYREHVGIPAKSVVIRMAGVGMGLVDAADPGTLEIVGFDGATPGVVNGFLQA